MIRLSPALRLRIRLVAMALIAVVPSVGIILYISAGVRSHARADALRDTRQIARLAASRQANVFDSVQRLLLTLAQFPAIRARSPVECDSSE